VHSGNITNIYDDDDSNINSNVYDIYIPRNIILPVVLYGCETWSLTLREERGLGVFEDRVLRKRFGPKRDEGRKEWRKLHNEEPNDLYSSLLLSVTKKHAGNGFLNKCWNGM